MTAITPAAGKHIRVTLVRSTFGRLQVHRACVRGLGLSRMHQSVEVERTPENLGMVNKAAFMLKVEQL
jgi:large subunit ribosomal protein L30